MFWAAGADLACEIRPDLCSEVRCVGRIAAASREKRGSSPATWTYRVCLDADAPRRDAHGSAGGRALHESRQKRVEVGRRASRPPLQPGPAAGLHERGEAVELGLAP